MAHDWCGTQFKKNDIFLNKKRYNRSEVCFFVWTVLLASATKQLQQHRFYTSFFVNSLINEKYYVDKPEVCCEQQRSRRGTCLLTRLELNQVN